MTSLIVLMLVLAAVWVLGLLGRGPTAMVEAWRHVPLLGALTCLVMAVGLWLR